MANLASFLSTNIHTDRSPSTRQALPSLHSLASMMRRVVQSVLGIEPLCLRGLQAATQPLVQFPQACACAASAGPNASFWTAAPQQPPSSGSGSPVVRPTTQHIHSLRQQQQPFALYPLTGQTRGLFIQTQSTPNPQSLMFLPGKTVMENGSKMFPNARSAMVSPLATRLFTLDGVTAVLFGSDFITVTKKDDNISWAVLKPDIFAAITDHLSSGEPLIHDEDTLAASDTAIHPDDSEVVAMIKELLETRIRPAVQEDGGDIKFKHFDPESGVVTVQMLGSCSGCPSSTVTLKSGVENMLMHYVPEVTSVVEEGEEAEEVEEDKGASAASAPKPAANPLEQHLSP